MAEGLAAAAADEAARVEGGGGVFRSYSFQRRRLAHGRANTMGVPRCGSRRLVLLTHEVPLRADDANGHADAVVPERVRVVLYQYDDPLPSNPRSASLPGVASSGCTELSCPLMYAGKDALSNSIHSPGRKLLPTMMYAGEMCGPPIPEFETIIWYRRFATSSALQIRCQACKQREQPGNSSRHGGATQSIAGFRLWGGWFERRGSLL